MIRIAFVIDTIISPRAGSENQLLKVINGLDRQKYEPHLITLRDSEWFSEARLPCPRLNLGIYSILSPGFFGVRKQFADYCRKNRIDLAQAFFIDSNLFLGLSGRKAGLAAVIASRRSMGAGYWHTPKTVAVMRWLEKRTTHYVANSRAAAEETIAVERTVPEKVSVIPNGIDLDRFHPVSDEEVATAREEWGVPVGATVIGAAANLRPVKNLRFLVDAAAELIPRHANLYFVVLGEGGLRGELEQRVVELGLEGRFLLPGSSETIARDLYAFDIAVLSSKGESLSNALMEYMCCGRPSIASDVGGNGELLTSDELGLLYQPGNRDEFVAAAEKLIGNPDLRRSMGEAARASVGKRFSLNRVIEQWQALYERLTAVRP